MKNKKWIVIFCVSTFLIAGFFPVGVAENYKIKEYFESNEPPLPGLMIGNEPIFKVEIEKNNIKQYQKISPVSVSDNIVDIITQIDESMILGYIENLTSYGPRVTGETGCIDAAEYIYNEFSSMGLEVRYDNWVYEGYDSNNVEATLPGTDPNSDDIYIVCGHYDTVYDSPGADDDGSGVVAVLIAAYLMSQYEFNNTIRFVAFSGEEEGLYGSYMYVQDAYYNGDDIKGVLNADMISFALNDEQSGLIKIYEDELSEWLYDFTSSVSLEYDEYIDLQMIHSGWSWGSDHYYFWEFGYNAIFYHEYEFNDYYHSPDDTIEHMNLTYDKKVTRLIVATLGELGELSSSNLPPETPIISGLISAKPKKEVLYNFSSTDPEGSNVYYFIDWADGTNSGWIGLYHSSEEITQSHIWLESGEYIIKAKAKDVLGAESDWGTLEITIPRSRINRDILILKLSERFPNIFLVLKYLLKN